MKAANESYRRRPGANQGSVRMVLSVTASMCGSSILTLPYGFYLAGLIGGPVLSLCAMLLMGLTCSWILKSQLLCGRHNQNISTSDDDPEVHTSEKDGEQHRHLSLQSREHLHIIPKSSTKLEEELRTVNEITETSERSTTATTNLDEKLPSNNTYKRGDLDSYDYTTTATASQAQLIAEKTTTDVEGTSISAFPSTLNLLVKDGANPDNIQTDNVSQFLGVSSNKKYSIARASMSRRNSQIQKKIEEEKDRRASETINNSQRRSELSYSESGLMNNKSINDNELRKKDLANMTKGERKLHKLYSFDEKDFPCKAAIDTTDFNAITKQLTNQAFGYVLSVAGFVIMFAVCTSYSIFLTDMISGIVCNFASSKFPEKSDKEPFPWCPLPDGTATDITYIRIIVACFFAVLLFGMACILNMRVIVKIASFGFIAFIILIIYMIVNAASNAPNGKWSNVDWSKELFKPNCLKFLGITMLNFSVHNSICSMMETHPRKENVVRDSWSSFITVYIIVNITGIVGYITFIASTNGVPQNFATVLPYDVFGIISRIVLCVDLIVVYPVVQRVMRQSVILWVPSRLCKKEAYHNCCATNSPFINYDGSKKGINFIINFLIIVVTIPIAIFYPQVGSVLGIAGAIGGGIYCLLAPTLIWRIMQILWRKWAKGKWAIIILIVIFGCAAIAMQFVTI